MTALENFNIMVLPVRLRELYSLVQSVEVLRPMSKGDWKRPIDDKETYQKNYEAIFGEPKLNIWNPEDEDHPNRDNGTGGHKGAEAPPVPSNDGSVDGRAEEDSDNQDREEVS